MTNEITYELLWQVCQKEKQTNELQNLPRSFYTDVLSFLKNIDKKDSTEDETDMAKNTRKLLTELYERRKQKILIYVAYKKQIPQPPIREELTFYDKLISIVRGTQLESSKTEKNVSTLKSAQSIPEILLPSGNKIGPLEKDQLVEIRNEEDIKFLLNNTICVEI